MKHIFLRRSLMAVCFLGMLALAPGVRAQNPTPGNLIIAQAASATANNTTASFVEINPSQTGQTTPVQSIVIPGTGANAIRISGSATSTGYLSRTNDGSLVVLTGVNTTNTTANVNTLNPRSVVTLNTSGAVAIATSYTGTSGNQTRSATSLNNTNWFIADQGGIYTNGSTSASPAINPRGIKAFGGTVYVGQASSTTTVIQVSTITTPSGGAVAGLPGLTNNASLQDFYLIQSGSNGSTYDVLYVISATSNTVGTIAKFSLVSGSWTANGTYTTAFGGFGLTAQRSGSAAKLYVTTGTGAASANSVVQLTDAAGYNSPIAINTANNLTLFTTAAGTTLKGIDFAPAAACPAIAATLNGTTTVCAGSSATLTASITGGTAPYSVTYSNGTSTSVISGTAISVSPATSTTYTIVSVTDANGCAATVSGTAIVTVNQPPTVANAGTSQTIVAGSSATLAANTPTSGTGMWSVTSGPSTLSSQFSSTTNPAATFTPAGGAGDYVLTWTISNAPCPASSSSVTITVVAAAQPDLTVSVSGPASATAGQGFTYNLVVSNIGAASATGISASFTLPAGITYTDAAGMSGFTGTQNGGVVSFTGGSLTQGNSATLTVTVSPNAAGTVTVPPGAAVVDPNNAIAESNEANNASTQTVTTTAVAACPTITATLTGNTNICAGSSATLTAMISGGAGPYSLTYSNGSTNTVVNNYTSGAAIMVSPATSTTYTIVGLTDANACPGTGSGPGVAVTVTPTTTVANAGPAQTIFFGSTAMLAANTPTNGTGMWSVSGPSDGMSQFSSPTNPTATFAPAGGPGTYTLTWTITNAPCPPSSSTTTITVVIPTVSLAVSSTTASETNPTAITVTATSAAPVVGDQTVALAVTGTGITPGDYTLSSTTITIPSGQTAGSVTFTVVDDNVVEGTETATLTISNPSANIALGSPTTQNITITDNDVAPGLSVSDVAMNEGNSGITVFPFTVSLAAPAPAGGVTFDIATQDGTATAGSDYTAKSLTGQTIPAGSSTYTFNVLVNGDLTFEPNETFFVNVTNVTGAVVGKGQGTGTITNDDVQPLPDLTISVAGPASATTGQPFTYSLVVSNVGTANATGISASFALPAGVTYASATGTGGFAGTQNGGVVSFTGGSLTQGSSATLTVGVTAAAAGTVTVSPGAALVDPNNAIAESNEANNSSTQAVSTTVNTANQPPVAPTFANQTGIVAVAFSYTVPAFADPESQSLTYTITGVPAGLSANNSTRVISGTPTTTGTSTLTVVATDPQSASTAGTFTITINANQPPVAAALTSQTATVGVAFSYAVPAFTDPENQPLTYAATGVPTPLTFDPVTRVVSGTPTAAGVSTITITATDPASNTVSATFSLSVSAAPVVIASLSLTASANPTMLFTTGTTTLSATVSGGTMPYSYSFSGPGTISASGNTASVSGLSAGVQTFTVIARDATTPTSQTISATVSVTVTTPSVSTTGIVISQVYGGGGNANAPYQNDYIELFNRTNAPISINGWSVQYASATGGSWTPTSLTGTIPAGGYYLVSEATSSTAIGASLPRADMAGNINLSATAGKVALVSNSTPLSVTCPTGATILDFVGYGTSANCFEGAGPTPAPSATLADLRKLSGCTDTDNNAADFATGVPTPRNAATPVNVCGPAVTSLSLVASANPTIILTTGTTTLSATVSGGTTPYSYTFTGPGTISPSGNTATVSGLPAGVQTFTVTVTDATAPTSQTISATVSVTVNAANQPPIAPTFANQTGIVAVAFSYTVPAFTDPESQSLTYTITGVPAGLSANNSTRVISGTPTTTGTSTLTVVATDPQSASTAGTFTITINANQPPVAAALTSQTATVGVAFSYAVPAFTDPENQPLTYAATGVPTPLTFDPVTRVVSGTPTAAGVSTITITATDPASNTVSATFSLSVNAAPTTPAGVIRITEYMYSSNNGAGNGVGEFVELTNVGNAPIDLTGWSFDDNTRQPGSFTLSGFGVVQPNESVVITDATAAQFRTFWYLPASVKVLGGNDQNLGRADEINIYDASNTLVDRLTYNDQGSPASATAVAVPSGSIRTQFKSGWPQRQYLGQNSVGNWQLSVAGDVQNSYLATTGDLGNPGGYFIPLARVKVVESGGTPGSTSVTEGGATDTYTVVLNSQPTANVTVTITPGSQLTLSTTTLTFTPANYSTVQTVTVTAIDDAVYQGAPRSVTITQTATSSDVAYNGIPVNPVSVTIIDNDVATTAAPVILATNPTPYLNLPATGPGYVSGVIGDPTDPASTLGVSFSLTDADTDVNSLTVTASSSSSNATLNLTGTGNTRTLRISPAGVGYATIIVAVSDGNNITNYVINYAASAASATQNTTTTRFHTGTSDASTAVLIDANYMLVGDDENQVLRLYNRQNSGLPVAGFDFTSLLGLTDISGGVPREVDLEASIRQNNRIFWIGSQSNKEPSGARPDRDRVFATDISGTGANTTLTYVGRYDYLREDIINWDVTNGHGKGANYYGLQASADANTNSKAPEGYNIEGAELAPNGTTAYIGFRAPQVLPANRTKALIVAVTNLTGLVNGQAQGSATFGAPIELDLGGRGIREIRKNANNDYVIIAGPAGDATGTSPSDFQLYTWTGNAADAPIIRLTNPMLTSLNANGSFESIVEVPNPLTGTSQLQLLVDNGDAVYYNDGTAAKDLAQNNFKKFRSDIVTLGAAPNTAPVATANSNQTATVGVLFSYTVNAFTDAETPTSLTYSASINPANGFTFNPTTRVISGTAVSAGVSSVTITATDSGSLSASTTFTITANPAPVVVTSLSLTVSASPTSILTTGTTTLSATVSGGTTPYSFTFTGPGTITASGNTASVSNLTAGVQTFTLVARDATSPTSQTISATVNVTVTAPTPVNTAPTATTNASQTATVGQAFSYMVNAFTDAETPNALTYSASINPANGLTFNPATRVISGTPSLSGVSTVSITATDPGSLSASTTFTITVSASATQPTGPATLTITSFNCVSANGGLSSVNFTVGYSDGTFTPALPPLFIVGVTASGQLGQPYTFGGFDGNVSTLPIADNASRSTYFVWNFRAACAGPVTPPVPTPPVAPVLANQMATQGTFFSYVVPAFSGTAPISYSATGLPTGLNFDASSRIISGTPSTTGVSTVMIQASNVAGQSSGQFTLTVSASATQPTGPATLTITSFNCVSANGGLSSVNFTVGYSDGSFTPALPPLFIVGVTAAGQLGQSYAFSGFDGNVSTLPIADNASRSTYFVWNFRAACAGTMVTPPVPTPPVAPTLPNQMATQGTFFSYVVPAFSGTAPISYSATGLPTGLNFDASSRTISGTPSTTGVSTVMIQASNTAGQSSGQFTLTVSASATQPTGPATLTITSFNCVSANGGLSSVNFVVGYSDGTFTPALPPLFINGVTASGQLGQSYSFGFDANVSVLPIADNASRSVYFVWNFRAACATRNNARAAAEPVVPLTIRVLGNPAHETVEAEVTGAEGSPLTLLLTDVQGLTIGQRNIGQAGSAERVKFNVGQQSAGVLLLRATTPTQSQTVRVLKVN